MRSAFITSWGPRIDDGGRTTFRLWAPAQDRVALLAEATQTALDMTPAGDGWFEIDTDAVKPGERYRFRLGDGTCVPDPASRGQSDDVHGPSLLLDPSAHTWRASGWKGRAWEETIVYELHVGTFTPEGTFDGAISKLDHLRDLGITAIEIMPVAQFAGNRGWGYDGVLLYCPHRAYGGGEGLKRLVDAAHQRGLMVILDVVYNHFGPDGNYLHLYAPEFFHPERKTPWGAAIAYEKRPVRDFFVENALYWLGEFHLDGLRLDAINQIEDQAEVPLLEELAQRVRKSFPDCSIHLMTEDDRNIVRLHERDAKGHVPLYTAEWNDDVHHAAHVIATGETEGYYEDYKDPVPKLARALAEGFVYQGEASPFWDGGRRGESSIEQPPAAFVDFLQNHDQIGNRAFGERLSVLAPQDLVRALTAVLLLSPHIPLLFMGEEWDERRPFCFFTDFHGELAEAVREGRRSEFKKWPAFADPARRAQIPDPNAPETFQACVLDWAKLADPAHAQRLAEVRQLLEARKAHVVPRIASMGGRCGRYSLSGPATLEVGWTCHDGELVMQANLGSAAVRLPAHAGNARMLFGTPSLLQPGELPPFGVVLSLWPRGGDGR
ncbi:MAG: malto-oligosyltrehalose trehalohydrolase [Hyphomicrobiales bacterium]|nr:MAG: malto-oligosyltrehalose trehalohydrolase [Hyphomicrobiales bacterium]